MSRHAPRHRDSEPDVPIAVTDSAEGPHWVKVSSPQGSHLVAADDKEGIAIAIDQLKGEYDVDDHS